jgi:hypothetical protein
MFTKAFYVKMRNILKGLTVTIEHFAVRLHCIVILMVAISVVAETHVFFNNFFALKALYIQPFNCNGSKTISLLVVSFDFKLYFGTQCVRAFLEHNFSGINNTLRIHLILGHKSIILKNRIINEENTEYKIVSGKCNE